jgi:hypothetical protein
MSDETKRKTLANCKLSEFTRQANRIRHAVADYYKTLDITGIRDRIAVEYKDADETKKQRLSKKFVSEIMDAMLEVNAEKTVEIIGMIAFLTYEESEKLEPDEAFDIVLECVGSDRVMNFFTRLVNLAGTGSDDTSRLLTSLRSITSGKNTSGNQSSNSTENTVNE